MMTIMSAAISFVVHLLGAVLWTGGILAISRVMVLMTKQPAALRPVLAHLGTRFNILALLGAVLSVASGLYQLSLWPVGFFKEARWMHHKLTLILVLVVVHGLCWTKLRTWQKADDKTPLSRGLAAGLHGVAGLVLIGILLTVYLGQHHYLRASNFP
jgi:putative membrane protein